jgi:hypothetical protein
MQRKRARDFHRPIKRICFISMKARFRDNLVAIGPLLLCLLTVSSSSAGGSDWQGLNDEGRRAYRGSYVNPIFGYSVALPENLMGIGSRPPAPNHGIAIDLDDGAGSQIGTDAEYNALDYKSATDIAESNVSGLRDFAGASKMKVRRESTTLCNFPAVRQTIEYKDASGKPCLDYGVFALLPRKKYPDIVYSVTLTTTPAAFEDAQPFFLRVLSSFKCMPATG